MSKKKEALFQRRQYRVRKAIRAKAKGRTRLAVFRSNQHIYAQLIDDVKKCTVAQASTLDKEVASKVKSKSNIEAAQAVGELIAKRAKDAKIEKVVFDRGGFIYHGRVKALADAARENGLNF